MKFQSLIRFDWAMKTLLRDKANFDVLEGFLTALLNEPIKIEELLESESNPEDGSDKFNRVDLLVRDSAGRRIIVEIQNQREADYLERLLYGSARVVVDSLKLGTEYRDVVKVISVSILYFNLGSGDDYVYYGTTEFRGLHTGHPLVVRKEVESPDRVIGYRPKNIFPEYYLINVERFQDVIAAPLDEWIYLFKHSEAPPNYQASGMAEAEQKLTVMRMTPEERRRYERYITNLVIEKDVIETSWEDGLAQGRSQGRLEGRSEGRLEERREIALRLQAAGWTMEQIGEFFGQPIDDVLKWLNESP
jgi:hypothetical protein